MGFVGRGMLMALALGASGCEFGLEQVALTDGDQPDASTGPAGTTGMPGSSTGGDGDTTGPADGAGGSGTTTGTTDTGSETGSSGGTGTGDGLCIDEGDCPEGWECDEAGECFNPAEGQACDGQNDCDPLAPLCIEEQCWDGNDGDPCPGSLCAVGFFCNPNAVCQDGDEGDPCDAFYDCGPTAPHCALDGRCHDGSENDSCNGNAQCQLGLFCGPAATCQTGDEGDPCTSPCTAPTRRRSARTT